MKLETIVAPTDLEDGSLPGLRAAAQLAHQTGSRLVVAHVLTSRAIDTTAPWHEERRDVRENAIRQAEERMDAQLDGLADGVEVDRRLVWGDPVDEVVGLAAEVDADVIVITSKHRSRVGKALMGSQTQRLILEADRPVLTVPVSRG